MTGNDIEGPFRWWSAEGRFEPVLHDVLYRNDEWLSEFFDHVDDALAQPRELPFKFDTRRPALVVTGQTDPGVLRVVRASYRDVLLFHPGLHPHIDALMDDVVRQAASHCANRAPTDALAVRGRRGLLAEPSRLLHRDVTRGLAQLGLSGLPALGVTGIVEARSRAGEFVLGVVRSESMAVNPGCLGPPVDGVHELRSPDSREDLAHEIADELPWEFDSWEPLGVLLPPRARTAVDGRPTRRCGVNVVFRTRIGGEPEDLLRRRRSSQETKELVLIRAPRDTAPAALPTVLAHRDGGVVELASVPEVSEVLAAVLHKLGVLEVPVPATSSPEPSPAPDPRRSEDDPMSARRPSAQAQMLEDAWADDLLRRHPRIGRVLDDDLLADLAENHDDPTDDKARGPVHDAVREYELVRRSGQVKAADDARLFEAVVYRVSRYLFGHNPERALKVHDSLLPSVDPAPDEPNPIGRAYQERLDAVLEQDRKEDPNDVWREVVRSQLEDLNREEAAQEYSEVARRARLLCFCAALWSLESQRRPEASATALDERYRRSLAGDVIALFFRARALLVSPVISAAQAQLGLQFVTTALATYAHNPGMHHTRAIFLLRQSSLTELEAVSRRCLDQALESVETALQWDAEFPIFYATRARVKYRLQDRAAALVDIRAAIELARYGAPTSPAVARDVAGWESVLDGWQLSPLGALGE